MVKKIIALKWIVPEPPLTGTDSFFEYYYIILSDSIPNKTKFEK